MAQAVNGRATRLPERQLDTEGSQLGQEQICERGGLPTDRQNEHTAAVGDEVEEVGQEDGVGSNA